MQFLLASTFLFHLSQSSFFPFFKFFADQFFSSRGLICGLVPSFSNAYPSLAHCSICLSPFWFWGSARLRVFFSHPTLPLQTSSRTVLHSGFSARELHPSVGTRRLLETKLWFSICRQFSFSPTEPHFALLSRTNKVHHISLSHVYSQSPVGHSAYSVSLYLFPVIIFHLSLFPKNKFFTEATPTRLFLTLELCGPFTYTIYALLV